MHHTCLPLACNQHPVTPAAAPCDPVGVLRSSSLPYAYHSFSESSCYFLNPFSTVCRFILGGCTIAYYFVVAVPMYHYTGTPAAVNQGGIDRQRILWPDWGWCLVMGSALLWFWIGAMALGKGLIKLGRQTCSGKWNLPLIAKLAIGQHTRHAALVQALAAPCVRELASS